MRSIIDEYADARVAARTLGLVAEIERLRAALEFYANGEWADGYPGGVYVESGTAIIDTGEKARAALKAPTKKG